MLCGGGHTSLHPDTVALSTASPTVATVPSVRGESVGVPVSRELLRVAATQEGVVTRRQARLMGMTDGAVRHAVVSGRWQRVRPRVFAVHVGPITGPAAAWAAVLYAGSGAALSHCSAAAIYGWCKAPSAIHVTVPASRVVTTQPGLVLHRASFGPRDVIRVSRLPATSPQRTLVDVVGSATTAGDALGAISRALQSRRVTASAVVTAIGERRLRWRREILEALDDLSGGSHSYLELQFARLLRAHGIPLGARQAAFGRTRVDMAYERVVIELDGRLGHDAQHERWRDMDRDNMQSLAGRTVLRFGWNDVRDRPCAVARQVAVATGHRARQCEGLCEL
jgi:very-short-patch-repair endonuclease